MKGKVQDHEQERFNPLHYGEGFLTRLKMFVGCLGAIVSIPCITGRVS